MNFTMAHSNLNVLDLKRSLSFYKEALGLVEVGHHQAQDGSFYLAFLGNRRSSYRLELTWLKERQGPYDLGDNESHLAFTVDDFEAAYQLHRKMGCICFENKEMGIYFIHDPDGYWIEILPEKPGDKV